MNTVRELWQEIIEKVKTEYFLTEVSFNTWLVPLKVYDVSEDTVTVIVPSQNEQTIQILLRKYKQLLEEWDLSYAAFASCLELLKKM